MDQLPQAALIWLLVFVVLGLLLLVTVRRMSVLVGRTRDLERFQQGVLDLDRRLGATADPFVGQLDEIRRRSGDPQALAGTLPAAQDALATLAAEGRALKAPAGLTSQLVTFNLELDRAVRALALVEHGLDALLADRGGRDLEAQTSLKRGALNLRHAREAATRAAREMAAVRPADLRPPADSRGRTTPLPAASAYLVEGEGDRESP
jgi:hypothetical protein